MMEEVTDKIVTLGGVLSGEHGDGLIRSWLNPRLFGNKIYEAFEKVKNVFDNENRMNPGKIVHAPPLEENLRLSPHSHFHPISTFLNFEQEGGFSLAADLCNGNGQCRKKEGILCPSFQASNDEYHTTRARAQAIRAIIHGHLLPDYLTRRKHIAVLVVC